MITFDMVHYMAVSQSLDQNLVELRKQGISEIDAVEQIFIKIVSAKDTLDKILYETLFNVMIERYSYLECVQKYMVLI